MSDYSGRMTLPSSATEDCEGSPEIETFGYGAPGLQAANFLVSFGAIDRLVVRLPIGADEGHAPGMGVRR